MFLIDSISVVLSLALAHRSRNTWNHGGGRVGTSTSFAKD